MPSHGTVNVATADSDFVHRLRDPPQREQACAELYELYGGRVLSYARLVAGVTAAQQVTTAALASAVVELGGSDSFDPAAPNVDGLVRRVVRRAAVQSVLGTTSPETEEAPCAETVEALDSGSEIGMLATGLAQHLRGCPACRALMERVQVAEAGFRVLEPPSDRLRDVTLSAMLAAASTPATVGRDASSVPPSAPTRRGPPEDEAIPPGAPIRAAMLAPRTPDAGGSARTPLTAERSAGGPARPPAGGGGSAPPWSPCRRPVPGRPPGEARPNGPAGEPGRRARAIPTQPLPAPRRRRRFEPRSCPASPRR